MKCDVCHLTHEPDYPCEAALASERSDIWQGRAVAAESARDTAIRERGEAQEGTEANVKLFDEWVEKASTAIRERDDALAVVTVVEKQLKRLEPERDAAETKLSACEELVERWRKEPRAGKWCVCADELAAVLTPVGKERTE